MIFKGTCPALKFQDSIMLLAYGDISAREHAYAFKIRL